MATPIARGLFHRGVRRFCLGSGESLWLRSGNFPVYGIRELSSLSLPNGAGNSRDWERKMGSFGRNLHSNSMLTSMSTSEFGTLPLPDDRPRRGHGYMQKTEESPKVDGDTKKRPSKDGQKRVAQMKYRILNQGLRKYGIDNLPAVWLAAKEKGFDLDVNAVNTYLRVSVSRMLSDQDVVRSMLALFDRLPDVGIEPNWTSYSILMRALEKRRHSSLEHLIVEIYELAKSKDLMPTKIDLGYLINIAINLESPVLACKLVQDLDVRNRSVPIYYANGLLRYLSKHDLVESVETLYGALRKSNSKFTVASYTILMSMYARRKEFGKARAVFNAMEQSNAKLQPTVVSYTVLFRIFGQLRDGESVLMLYNRLKEKGIDLDLRGYRVLASALATSGYFHEVTEILDEMNSNGFAPGESVYADLMKTVCRDGNVSVAMMFYERMKSQGVDPNVDVFNAMLNLFAQLADVDSAAVIFQTMKNRKVMPNIESYNTMMKVYKAAFAVSKMKKLYQEMVDADVYPNETTNRLMFQIYSDLDDERMKKKFDKLSVGKIMRPQSQDGDAQ